MDTRHSTHRVISLLDRKEIDFLDKIGKDALFSTGRKLSHNEIIKALVDFAMELGLFGEHIGSPQTLKDKLYELMKKHMEQKPNEGPVSPLDIADETGSKFTCLR